MKDATAEIVSELSHKGYRITKARKAVVKALSTSGQPITIQALRALVEDIDEVSVYRTIAMLVKEGFAEELSLPGEAARYAFSHGHHHHAVCTSCGWMEHIECIQEGLLGKVPASFKSLKSHEVTFYGLCKKCA
jgi:Fe2+ or Zn2+ uptake regulation protein